MNAAAGLLAHVDGSDPWEFHAHPEVWVLVVGIGVGYWWALTRLGPRLAPAGQAVATGRQVVAFASGLMVLWVFADWPVHDISESYLFSVHMAQHTAFSLVAAPLFLVGTPAWLLRSMVRPAWLQAVLRRVTRPLAATLVFNGVVAATHWTGWMDFTLRHEAAHFAGHLLLFTAAVVMWLPVVDKLPEIVNLSYPVRMVYLFGQSILPNVPAAFLIFAERPIYRFYAAAPRAFAWSAVEDQQVAGAIMKIVGTTIIWGVIVGMFFHWYAVSQRDQGDVLTWDDVERELARTSAPR